MADPNSRKLMDAFGDIAMMMSQYYHELIKCGFNEQQAMQLVIAYQAEVVRNGFNLRREEDGS